MEKLSREQLLAIVPRIQQIFALMNWPAPVGIRVIEDYIETGDVALEIDGNWVLCQAPYPVESLAPRMALKWQVDVFIVHHSGNREIPDDGDVSTVGVFPAWWDAARFVLLKEIESRVDALVEAWPEEDAP